MILLLFGRRKGLKGRDKPSEWSCLEVPGWKRICIEEEGFATRSRMTYIKTIFPSTQDDPKA